MTCTIQDNGALYAAIVAWANVAMMEDDVEEAYYDIIRDAVARFGLADARALGLTWEDYKSILKQLGYNVREIL